MLSLDDYKLVKLKLFNINNQPYLRLADEHHVRACMRASIYVCGRGSTEVDISHSLNPLPPSFFTFNWKIVAKKIWISVCCNSIYTYFRLICHTCTHTILKHMWTRIHTNPQHIFYVSVKLAKNFADRPRSRSV